MMQPLSKTLLPDVVSVCVLLSIGIDLIEQNCNAVKWLFRSFAKVDGTFLKFPEVFQSLLILFK